MGIKWGELETNFEIAQWGDDPLLKDFENQIYDLVSSIPWPSLVTSPRPKTRSDDLPAFPSSRLAGLRSLRTGVLAAFIFVIQL